MDFDYSPDQAALASAASQLLGRMAPIERVAEVADSGSPYDRDLWNAVVEQGWLALDLGAEMGGLGLGLVEVSILAEELGATLAPIPYVPCVLARRALERAVAGGASPDLQIGDHTVTEWIARIAGGTELATLAWRRDFADAPSSWDPGWYAPHASLVVACVVDRNEVLRLEAYAANAPGTMQREPAMDGTRELGLLDSSGRQPVLLGDGAAASAVVDMAAAVVAAELLGASSRVLDMAVAYAKDRVQFGRPIGSFQAVKHRLADMLVDVEAMRSAVTYAAWCVGAGDPEASLAASAAKIWASDASRRCMDSALQVHGGIGFTWEHPLHRYVKRAQLDHVSFGDAPWHRSRLARMLSERSRAGIPVI